MYYLLTDLNLPLVEKLKRIFYGALLSLFVHFDMVDYVSMCAPC
jgi:hypothetical protein